MFTVERIPRLLGVSLVVFTCARVASSQTLSEPRWQATTAHPPAGFGTQDYTVTSISALGFYPGDSSQEYHTSGSLGRFGGVNAEQHFYAPLEIPAGVIIDFIGFSNLNDGEANVMAIHLLRREANGDLTDLVDLDNTPHTVWEMDFNGSPLGILWLGTGTGFTSFTLILDMEVAPNPNLQYFGSVQVWWRRTVSPAPANASFNDVPTTHPFFQYIEALKNSGITGGCQASPPLFCPSEPVTRGQMAVFLAKALGLHWPD